jgi:hypothetical protein
MGKFKELQSDCHTEREQNQTKIVSTKRSSDRSQSRPVLTFEKVGRRLHFRGLESDWVKSNPEQLELAVDR